MDSNANPQLELARRFIALADEDVPWFGGDSDRWGDEQDRSDYFEQRAGELEAVGARLSELILALDKHSERGVHGRKAIEVGTPDFEQNDLRTNAVDAIANILHALEEDGQLPGLSDYAARCVVQSALGHFTAELRKEDW